jgi:hypothetical protein
VQDRNKGESETGVYRILVVGSASATSSLTCRICFYFDDQPVRATPVGMALHLQSKKSFSRAQRRLTLRGFDPYDR